tara:strand:- start:2788 stop:2916 length:129 start_codon:yes stop_codon:yes gene_type:complete
MLGFLLSQEEPGASIRDQHLNIVVGKHFGNGGEKLEGKQLTR